MESKFKHILSFISVAIVIVGSHASLPSEDYWKSVLPNSPMPKAVKDLLTPPDWLNRKDTEVGITKGGVNVNTGPGEPGGTDVGVTKGGVNLNTGPGEPSGTDVGVTKGGVNVNTRPGEPGGTDVNVGHGSVGVHTGKPRSRTDVGVGKGGVTVGTGTRTGKPIHVWVNPGPDPFKYNYAATETQLHENPNVALFFLEKDMHAGKKMNMQFIKTTNEATFLPRRDAESIPFSSKKLPEILNTFSLNPTSEEAKIMKKTITECEEKGVKGEEKICATSLESMVDFTTSKLGKDVKAISTNAENAQKKAYTITRVKKMANEKGVVVVCHRQEYAYAVFYCHKTDKTVAYEVEMAGSDGSKATAVAVCHRNTAAWNPKHLAFQVLKVKPGTVPVCHFLPQNHIVWVPKY